MAGLGLQNIDEFIREATHDDYYMLGQAFTEATRKAVEKSIDDSRKNEQR